MIKLNLKAFTLVELIVVITILAILATVAFISFQGYIENARDSVRMTDVKNIEKSLGVHAITQGSYPEPSNPVNITFSGTTAWTQGTFGPSVIQNIGNMSQPPVDPLTKNQYSYSVTTRKNEFQVGAILENQVSNTVIQTYAENDTAYAYIHGNYNGKILGLRVATTDYILGVPSIIASDILSVNILDIISQKKLSYSGFNNLPSSYSGTTYNSLGGFDFGPSDIVVWSGSVNDLKTKSSERELFADKLKLLYETSIIKDSAKIQAIVNTTTENKDYFASIILNEGIGTHIKVSEPIIGGTSPTPPVPTSTKFITTWDVGLDTGVSGFGKLKLPLQNGGTYNFTVDWGDGNTNVITSYNQAEATHTYASNGIYDVTIDGTIEGFAFAENVWADNQHDGDKLIDIKNWGNVKIADGGGQFAQVKNLVSWSALDIPNTSHITNMSYMFYNATKFNQALSFNTSNVTDMGDMFRDATSFNKPISFDTRNVNYMYNMFNGATSFNQPLNFNTSNVTHMQNMFFDATSFNGTLTFSDTSKVTMMSAMFLNASLFNKPVNFDTRNVLDMAQMFRDATSFDQPLNFNTSKVTDMGDMFRGATAFDKPLTFSDTSKVTIMRYMFNGATKFNQNISNWCVSSFASEPTGFSTSSALTSGNKPIWGTCP